MKIKLGITGEEGFIGRHVARQVSLLPEEFELVQYEISYFENDALLDEFTAQCDAIIHLAAMNRHEDQQVIFDTNLALNNKLIASLKRTDSKAHVLFSSSTQEDLDNLYGRSKKLGGELLFNWAEESQGRFSSIVIPNVYGPFGRPYYNSVVATFCHQLTHEEEPTVNNNNPVNLIYVGELVGEFLKVIVKGRGAESFTEKVRVEPTASIGVEDLYLKLVSYRDQYFKQGVVPSLNNRFEINLFNTYRSFIEHGTYFPRPYTLHTDDRGSFVEIVRLMTGGQVSYSTTEPNITRGNHFHTRKVERFAVISGKASIELRKIDSEEVLSFELSGEQPAYVDMPIWYTHNITNIGDEELITLFWINEFYDPNDPDTYFVNV